MIQIPGKLTQFAFGIGGGNALGEIAGGSLKVGEDSRLKSVAFKDFEELDTLEVHPPMGKLLKQMPYL